jgi:hypothetical protein
MGESFMECMLMQMHTLELTYEIERLSKGPGGTKWKQKFNLDAFQSCERYKHHFASLTRTQKEEKMATLTKEYKEWMQTNQELVTHRN